MQKSADNVATTEPLGLPPKQAARMGVGGLTGIYDHLKRGRLESYKVGRATFITVESIKALAARLLAEEKARRAAEAEPSKDGPTAAAVAARRAKHAAKLAGTPSVTGDAPAPEKMKGKPRPKVKAKAARVLATPAGGAP